MTGEFRNALPSHIKPEKFQRVVMTVVQQNPDLMGADRRSLLASCLKCAADGLIPDGREAALVIFKTKINEQWVSAVQYMPMLAGIQIYRDRMRLAMVGLPETMRGNISAKPKPVARRNSAGKMSRALKRRKTRAQTMS